ncbi:protein translocase subunit SecF [Corallincola luteus]|uniref:Protein-export membrane protein SecF n=2 Tax=Corallincola TaxID=1775176 RepID=A0A368NE57_9GAMM|nr:protein translocase subunit SecF [Corallincola holothuriorum]TCI01674.1 protein translocase subunit SecF [Corallincola luteus]
MFQLLNFKDTVQFMAFRGLFRWVSLILVVGSIAILSVNRLNWGLDFTGGTLVELGFEQPADIPAIRTVLEANNFADAVVQHFGSSRDVVIRMTPRDGIDAAKVADDLVAGLRASDVGTFELHRIDFIGPTIGAELRETGGLATLVALLCILAYVTMRFEWRLALGAVAALAHDVIITLGVFSLFKLEFDTTVLAAILAVIGYSLNDTIVVMDRIRENFRKVRKGEVEEIINISLTQTMSRTVITSLTTLLVLIALFYLGGASIHGFATALLCGVLVGTYSSIYVASTIAMGLGISREDLMPTEVEKEGADQDPMMM